MSLHETNLVKPLDDIAIAARLFDEIAAFSPDDKGVSRPAFSEIETRTLDYLATFARQQGLVARYDAGGNVLFSLPKDMEASRYILVGSHVDTVPNGGNFDGLAGVLAGLVCLLRALHAGQSFSRPVKVIALRAEESAWFGPCYIASKALLGKLTDEELDARHKGDGRTLAAHMEEIGIEMIPLWRHQPLIDPGSIETYLELHIEQGPLLVQRQMPAAVVSGIRGNIRHKKITCIGEPGHSGAVPRAYRKDPVLALADLLSRMDESWSTILQTGGDLVFTSGIVSTDPARHALTRIPDQVEFSIDMRSQSAETLSEARMLLHREMASIERDRGVRFALDEEIYTAPALCHPALVEGLQEAMKQAGQEPFAMASGAGHDAAVFANAGIPSAMVFVRNRNGSHNPDEAMDVPDLIAGTDILYHYLTGEACGKE